MQGGAGLRIVLKRMVEETSSALVGDSLSAVWHTAVPRLLHRLGSSMSLVPWCLPLQPREDPGQASAMKILYLLFPFFLLLIQGAAGERGRGEMG